MKKLMWLSTENMTEHQPNLSIEQNFLFSLDHLVSKELALSLAKFLEYCVEGRNRDWNKD